jgi:hypothetical protein
MVDVVYACLCMVFCWCASRDRCNDGCPQATLPWDGIVVVCSRAVGIVCLPSTRCLHHAKVGWYSARFDAKRCGRDDAESGVV